MFQLPCPRHAQVMHGSRTCYNCGMVNKKRPGYFPSVSSRVLATLITVALVSGCVLSETDRNPQTDAEKRAAIETMFKKYRDAFPDVKDVTPAQLRDMEAKGNTLLVDVRTPKERAVAVIPGSISKEEFEAHPGAYAGKKVVAYCTIGYRSGIYAETLRKKGIDAYNLQGSILSWVHDGGKVVDPKGFETHTVDVYGKEWDLLPEGYKGVW